MGSLDLATNKEHHEVYTSSFLVHVPG